MSDLDQDYDLRNNLKILLWVMVLGSRYYIQVIFTYYFVLRVNTMVPSLQTSFYNNSNFIIFKQYAG